MNPIRRAATEALPAGKGIFLRCDRGDALYVTNCPSRTDETVDWEAAGFRCRDAGGLCYLVPEERLISSFEEWLRSRTEETYLSPAVRNAAFGEAEQEDDALLYEGVKRLELHGDGTGYEKMVRQRAAVCLRERRGGRHIELCALIADRMKQGGGKDEDSLAGTCML